ncbi:MAG: Zn-ribbon domain-containing OB-fold protein [Chloroflexi bacterium]|nr:Zn-ribbon domain-containing OB-fold protein [Chloroflexota bacterium]
MVGSDRSKAVPLKEGLYNLLDSGEVANLIGSRCRRCGESFYPRRVVCLNCGSRELEDVALSRTGELWSYTVVTQKAPFALVEAPYTVAVVKLLPEEVPVLTVMDNCDASSLKVGMRVKLKTKKVGQNAEGKAMVAFAFEPA